MSRLNIVSQEQASDRVQGLFSDVKEQLGMVPNFIGVLANSPAVLESFLHASSGLAGGTLDLATRERIALAVAEENACEYCVAAHTALAEQAGLDGDEIIAARNGGSADAKADAAVKFAREVLENKGAVTSAELNAVRESGFSDGEIVEIIANVAVNTWTNFLGKAGQIDIDFPEVALLN